MSERLAISGYFRASDPGRFEGVDDVNDIQLIARRQSNTRQNGDKKGKPRHSKAGGKKKVVRESDGLSGTAQEKHLQDHLDSEEEGQEEEGSEEEGSFEEGDLGEGQSNL